MVATSIVSALQWWAHAKGEQTAIVLGEDHLTYAELHEWSSRVGRQLEERGVRAGDRVCVLGLNSLEWCATAMGVLKAGAVLVPLNPRLVAPEVKKLVDEVEAKVVITEPMFAPVIDKVGDLGASFDRLSFEDIGELRTGRADDFVVDVGAEDTALLLFTSGSTGLSKGVVCSNRQVLNIVFEASLTEEGLRPETTIMLVLPLAFTPGLVWGLCMNTVLGGKIVIERDLDPSRAVKLIEQHQAQAMFGVPLIFGALTKAPEFQDADLSSLKSALTGGAPVPVPLLEAYAAKGVKLRQIYGMTEAGGVATGTLVRDAEEHPDTCGHGSIFTEFKVVRDDGSECEHGEPGEVILRGPGMTIGYWRDEENTDKAIRNGWLHSGDLGLTTEDGRLRFVDRIKDLIISGGINVSPVEIEQVLAAIDGVEEVAVIRAEDEKFGETPAAILVGKDLDVDAIIAHCNEQLADYKVPRYVVTRTEELPKLPNGKLAKVAVREEYSDVHRTHDKVR